MIHLHLTNVPMSHHQAYRKFLNLCVQRDNRMPVLNQPGHSRSQSPDRLRKRRIAEAAEELQMYFQYT